MCIYIYMYIHVSIYIYMCVCVCVCIHSRERERKGLNLQPRSQAGNLSAYGIKLQQTEPHQLGPRCSHLIEPSL